jgi:hypothetical protein
VIRPGRRRRGGAAAVALAASLALTPLLGACGTQAGAAAVVGDRRITVDELQTATAEVRSIVQDPSQVTQQLVLGWLIAHPYVVQVASEQGKAVSRQDAESLFTRSNFTAPGGGTTPSESAVDAVQTAYALQMLTGQDSSPEVAKKSVDEVLADLKEAKVRVNPRYGNFDYRWDEQSQTFPLSPRTPGWLAPATPSATETGAAPTPTPSSS